MNKTDKIREGQIQIDDEHNYKPLVEPMLNVTHSKVVRLINYGSTQLINCIVEFSAVEKIFFIIIIYTVKNIMTQ